MAIVLYTSPDLAALASLEATCPAGKIWNRLAEVRHQALDLVASVGQIKGSILQSAQGCLNAVSRRNHELERLRRFP